MNLKSLFFEQETTVNATDQFVNDVSTDTAIPGGIIAAIIAFIMQMISSCPAPTPPTPAEVISCATPRALITIYRAMLANGIRPLSADGQKILKSMQGHAGKLTQDDAAAFLSQC